MQTVENVPWIRVCGPRPLLRLWSVGQGSVINPQPFTMILRETLKTATSATTPCIVETSCKFCKVEKTVTSCSFGISFTPAHSVFSSGSPWAKFRLSLILLYGESLFEMSQYVSPGTLIFSPCYMDMSSLSSPFAIFAETAEDTKDWV